MFNLLVILLICCLLKIIIHKSLIFPDGEFTDYLTTEELHVRGDHVTVTNDHKDLWKKVKHIQF